MSSYCLKPLVALEPHALVMVWPPQPLQSYRAPFCISSQAALFPLPLILLHSCCRAWALSRSAVALLYLPFPPFPLNLSSGATASGSHQPPSLVPSVIARPLGPAAGKQAR